MDIKYSKRILILGAREAGCLDVVKDLTGSAPSPDINGSTAGLTHEWNVCTTYYNATVPIWIDEVPDFEAWKSEFTKEEAKEVVDAVGAWIFCHQGKPDDTGFEEAMKSIQSVVETHSEGYAGEVVMLAVEKSPSTAAGQKEDQEDKCMEFGFEYIDYTANGTNEFGEKQGFERLKEALEANEWIVGAGNDELGFDELGIGEDEDGDFGHEEAEMTAELYGMKAALNNVDGEDGLDDEPEVQAGQVDDLNRMIGKLLAIKEQSADLPEEQRKRMAARAVKELMNEKPGI